MVKETEKMKQVVGIRREGVRRVPAGKEVPQETFHGRDRLTRVAE
jgi:S-adenosylmethionine hydrolase